MIRRKSFRYQTQIICHKNPDFNDICPSFKKMRLNTLPVGLFTENPMVDGCQLAKCCESPFPICQEHNLRQYSLCNQRSDKAFTKAIPL